MCKCEVIYINCKMAAKNTIFMQLICFVDYKFFSENCFTYGSLFFPYYLSLYCCFYTVKLLTISYSDHQIFYNNQKKLLLFPSRKRATMGEEISKFTTTCTTYFHYFIYCGGAILFVWGFIWNGSLLPHWTCKLKSFEKGATTWKLMGFDTSELYRKHYVPGGHNFKVPNLGSGSGVGLNIPIIDVISKFFIENGSALILIIIVIKINNTVVHDVGIWGCNTMARKNLKINRK